uniref:Microtubule associated tumor suppressor 1b n=1 Tax=Mola mola TaxID=94237 RepID=A0A3Q3WD37_MOLML
MIWSPKLSLSNIHVRLTAKGLLRSIQLLSGCRKNTVVFQSVDKNKPKASSGQQASQQQASQPSQVNGPPDVVPASASKGRRKDQSIQQLKGLLASSNCRFEAFAIVLQQILTERLEKEKEELRVSLEDALQELQEQHQKDMAELERRLQDFYQAEWDKVHLTYQEEADKCKSLMQQQMGELKATHEAMKQELQNSHTEQLQSKDSHTLYLEQELDSLKVVLDIKNKQLHQHEKKLMELDKLKDKNVKLDESLKKVQQENEDLKARMDRHAALSRQLSTEQAVLQESLQKESKENKRLSMENEELLWKLYNGDLNSPRRISPTSASPSHSFSFQSPSSSNLLSSPSVSPR